MGSPLQAKVELIGRKNENLPNLGYVDENYLRGGQPNPTGFKMLADLGVTTIIDLRGSTLDVTHERDEDKKIVRNLKMDYFNIPLSGIFAATKDQMDVIFHYITLPRIREDLFFVHCREGIDRTGEITALYEIRFNHLSPEAAYKNMQEFGYKPFRGLIPRYGMRSLVLNAGR